MTAVATLPVAKAPPLKGLKGVDRAAVKERPSKQPTSKPSRSMTHPVRDPKLPKKRTKHYEPFDPEDLSRRLTALLAQQKAHAQRRREARPAREATTAALSTAQARPATAHPEGPDRHSSGPYHHVPKVAAVAFERTATPEVMRSKSHPKLASPALNTHLETLARDEPLSPPHRPLMSLQRTQEADQTEREREKLRNRNQFQRTSDMEDAAVVDAEREVYRAPTRTFGELAHLRNGASVTRHSRPLSVGEVFSDSEEHETPAHVQVKRKATRVFDGRNDWAQREEEREVERGERRTVKEKMTPFLRRTESVWVLMGKKEKSPKRDHVVGVGECGSPPSSGEGSKKASFLARFKRHPS